MRKSKKKQKWLKILLRIGQIFGLLFALATLLFPIQFSPVWIFTKYRSLKPYIIAQAKVESDNFTSPLFKRSGNMFGMKQASIRKRIQLPSNESQYASYWKMSGLSLIDFLLWANYNRMPTEFESIYKYARWLKDKDYYEITALAYGNALHNRLTT